jgi:hypothetical protein
MRNTRTMCADWRMLYADDGSLAIGLLPHDDSEALIIPVDAALLRVLGRALFDAADRGLHN